MKTIFTLLLIIGLNTAYGQKNAGTAIPSMGSAYLKGNKTNKTELKKTNDANQKLVKEWSFVQESMKNKKPGTYFGSSKTVTVITETGKTYTVANIEDKSNFEDGCVAYTNTAKDTLFIQNCSFGKMIKEIWDMDSKIIGKKPVIQMVNSISAVMAAHKPKSIADKDKKLKN